MRGKVALKLHHQLVRENAVLFRRGNGAHKDNQSQQEVGHDHCP